MTLLAKKPADEISEMWQSRALRASTGKLRKVLIVALAKEYPAALVTLLRVTFAGFEDISRPFFSGYASIDLGGRVVCDLIDDDGEKRLTVPVYESEQLFISEVRKLADRLKLPDRDRTEMFAVLQKWVASDRRIGVHGQRLAS